MHSIPQDFERALKRNRLHGFFIECAYVHRAGYLSWIVTSVRPETRRLRIERSIARLEAQRAELLAATGEPPHPEISRPAISGQGSGLGDMRRSA